MGLFSKNETPNATLLAQVEQLRAQNAKMAEELMAQVVPIDQTDPNQLVVLQAAKDQADQRVQTLKAEHAAAQKQLATLKTAQTATQQQLAELTNQQTASQQRISDLLNQAETDRRQIHDLKAQAETERQRVSDLRDKKETDRQRISDLLDKKEVDRQRISDLLDKLEADRQRVSDLSAWGFLETRAAGHHYVYELRLENGYYYVGETSNLHERLSSHFAGYNEQGLKSAYWTSKHHPVAIIGLIEFDEQTTPTATIREKETLETLRLMRLYGYEKVRGGCFTAENADQLAYFLNQSDRQTEFHYTPDEIGLAPVAPQASASATASSSAIKTEASVQPVAEKSAAAPANKPQSRADHEADQLDPDGDLVHYLDDPDHHLKRYAAFKQADPRSFALVVMTNGEQYLIFKRQCQNLVTVFKRLEGDLMRLSDPAVKSSSFDQVVELITLDRDDYPNGAAADQQLAQKIANIKKNGSRTVLTETFN